MKISDKGLELIKSFEGLSLKAYPDPGTGGEPITIGYGHTGGVKLGDEITQEEADELLRLDVHRFEECVNESVEVEMTQGMFDALVSFSYNCGCASLKASTLLKLLNQGNKEAAAQQFGRWNKSVGKVLPGLTRRREAEKKLFME